MLRCGCLNLCENTLLYNKSWLTSSLSTAILRKLQLCRALLFPVLIFSLLALCNEARAQACVGNYSSVSCGGNQFCCFNDPSNCGTGSSPCCSGGKVCNASNIPSWTCSGQYACVAMGSAPSGAAAGSYPIGLCSNTCMAVAPTATPTATPAPTAIATATVAPTPYVPADCPVASFVAWNGGGTKYCSAYLWPGKLLHGQSKVMESDTLNPYNSPGSRTYRCDNGVLVPLDVGTCG